MKVDINHLRYLREELKKINSVDLHDIELVDGDKPLSIDPEAVEHWRFIGLSNVDFLENLSVSEDGINWTVEFLVV